MPLGGGDLAALDLGYPPRRDAHGLGELGLEEAMALALLSGPVPALPRHGRLAPLLGFSTRLM